MLTDSLARWTSEWRKLKRFLHLEADLAALRAESESIKELLKEFVAEKKAPVDALRPTFFARLHAIKPLFETLHSIVKLSQSSSIPVISSIPWWLHQIDCALVRVEDDPTAVNDWRDGFRLLFEKQFKSLRISANGMWLAAALDPRFASLSFFHLADPEIEKVWDMLADEHVNFKLARGELKELEFKLTAAKETIARGYVTSVRDSLVSFSKGTHDDNYAEFKELCQTACMILSSPGTTAMSERGVMRTRLSLTPFRSMLSEGMMDQEVVASHFIGTKFYSFSKLCAEVLSENQKVAKASGKTKMAGAAAPASSKK
jgi:hypothetical protein